MKNKTLKGNGKKESISQIVFKLLAKKGNLSHLTGKTIAFELIPRVKQQYPKSAFSLAHVSWYLSRARQQRREGLGLDRLHTVMPIKAAKIAKPRN